MTVSTLPFAHRIGASSYYLSLVDRDVPDDPILAQVMPRNEELNDNRFMDDDPLKEERYMPLPGLVHRYPDRVLLLLTDRCATYCRFCTRRRRTITAGTPENAQRVSDFNNQNKEIQISLPIIHDTELDETHGTSDSGFDITHSLRYISDHNEVREAILSGGDPLVWSDRKLELLLRGLGDIPHLYSIRIHTRVPVVMPSRITERFTDLLRRFYPITLVTHFNHPHEITPESSEAVRKLKMAGVTVLNQSVLLKNINDSFSVMSELLLKLLRIGVKPYYLHQVDQVQGVSHFSCNPKSGLKLMKELRTHLPGVALPTYILDMPQDRGKIPAELFYGSESIQIL